MRAAIAPRRAAHYFARHFLEADQIMSEASTEPNTVQPGETAPAPEAETLTPEQIGELQTKAAQAGEYYERLLRVTADFDNFKKRAARERDEARRGATEATLGKLLPVLDNFDMALVATNQPNANIETVKVGVTMIHGQLRGIFTDAGLEEINAVGQAFDPSLHEAVSQQETSEVPEGQVVQQVRKGYRLRERLLRPASVVVAKKPSEAAPLAS
jgi:molecular chaperone GrpE